MQINFMTGVVIWGVAALTGAAVGGILAGVKNRDYSSWMGWGFLVPPIVLVYFLLPKLEGPRPRRRSLDEIDHD